MRFRNIATTAVGAVTAGVLVFSSLSTAAVAAGAPSSAGDVAAVSAAAVTEPGSVLTARSFGQALEYTPGFSVTQLDQQLTIKAGKLPEFSGPPVTVVANKIDVEAVFTLNGQDITGTGSSTPRGAAPFIGSGLTMPNIVVDLPFGSAAGTLTLKSFKVVLNGTSNIAFAVGATPASISFDAVSDPALLAKYSTWALGVGDKFEVAQNDTELSLRIADFPKIAGIPPFVTVSAVKLDAVFTHGEKDIAFTGSSTIEPATPMADGFAFPALKGALPAGTAAGELKLKEISAVVTAGGSPTDIAIEIRRPLTVAFAATQAEVPAGHTAFSCTGSFGPMSYTSELKPVVKRNGDNVDVSIALGDMAGVVPVAAQADMVTEMGLTVNGVAVTAKGQAPGTAIGPRQPIQLPAVAASVATDATAIDIKATSLKITVANFNMEFPCTLAAPAELGSFTVDAKTVEGPKAPVAAKTTSKVTSVKVAKSKKATVKVSVKAGKTNATGKAKITIKSGKKTVAIKTVTLKKGASSFTSKKLKAGKYTATVSFNGSKNFKKSASKAKKFTVKK